MLFVNNELKRDDYIGLEGVNKGNNGNTMVVGKVKSGFLGLDKRGREGYDQCRSYLPSFFHKRTDGIEVFAFRHNEQALSVAFQPP